MADVSESELAGAVAPAGKISLPIKLAYGAGRLAITVKVRAFETFRFFHYVQVLKLSSGLAGLAVGIAPYR